MKQKKLTVAIIALAGSSVAPAFSSTLPFHLNFSRPEIAVQESRDFSFPSVNAPFSITLNFTGGLTPSQQQVFLTAKAAWEGRLSGYQPGISVGSITIDASSIAIDGSGGTLGRAGPTWIADQAGFTLATEGLMEFDSADMSAMESNGSLQAVIEHEMGHVLGFGTLWSHNTGYVNGSFEYRGVHGIDAWNAEFTPGNLFSYVPVENEGGEGTRNSHWNENAQGSGTTGFSDAHGRDMQNELMTGWINLPAFFSNTTLISMRDLGFTINQPPPQPRPQTTLSITMNAGGKVVGNGIDCKQNCTVSFGIDSAVQLEAVPNWNYFFSGWGGECSGDQACEFVLDIDRAVSANFQLRPAPAIACFTSPVEIVDGYSQDTIIQSEQAITVTKDAAIEHGVRLTVESSTAIHFHREFSVSKCSQLSADVVPGLSCGTP